MFQQLKFNGEVAVVTSAESDVGRSTAHAVAELGASFVHGASIPVDGGQTIN